MSTVRITGDVLRATGACSLAAERFKKLWPEGLPVTRKSLNLILESGFREVYMYTGLTRSVFFYPLCSLSVCSLSEWIYPPPPLQMLSVRVRYFIAPNA